MRFITLVAGAVALALSLPAQEANAQSNDPRANDSWIFCDVATEEGDRVYTPVFRGNWHSDINGAFESRVRRQWTPVTDPGYCHYWLIRDGGSRDDAQDYLEAHVMADTARKRAIRWRWSYDLKQ